MPPGDSSSALQAGQSGLAAGDQLLLEVGEPAAGGACVARAPDGRVVFVRHSLPGELVRAQVTSVAAHLLRADAVEVLQASAERVAPACPHAGPGRCGGCDFQHASPAAQQAIKARLVEQALRRFAGIEAAIVVEPAPGGALLGWRTRIRFGADPAGRLGLRRHRSHRLELVEDCPLAAPAAAAAALTARRWPGAAEVEAFAPGGAAALSVRPRPGRRFRPPPLPAAAELWPAAGRVVAEVLGRRFEISRGVFWQVHRQAPEVLVRAVLEVLEPEEGERALDLHAGAGLFAVHLALALGRRGLVLAVEQDRAACADARRNAADLPQLEVLEARASAALVPALPPVDLVVLDPPRAGAGVELITALLGRRPPPRRVAYVACDPASWARDLGAARALGWQLRSLRAFDLFPMTEHVEVLAVLEPVRSR